MKLNLSDKSLLYRRMATGAFIAFVLIAIFLYGGGALDPKWPKFWYIRPLIIVPLAGATGGLFYHLLEPYRHSGLWITAGVNLLCLIVYIIGLWLGSVLGLAGVWWD